MNILWPNDDEQADLANGKVNVWAVPLLMDPSRWDSYWRTLTADERGRANDFRLDDPKRRFVIARGALRKLLGRYLRMHPTEVKVVLDDNGKPCLGQKCSNFDLRFNVSHSGELAVIGFVIGCEIGVDVELVREVLHMPRIVERFFHPHETQTILDQPAENRSGAFLRCWTGKEAVLKAVGVGLSGSLANFQIPIRDNWQGWIDVQAKNNAGRNSRCWLRHLVPCDGYAAAVACVEYQCDVRCFAFPV
jgi:4'-phosphopantetheinyl transferase